jgi:hypothetical protein
MAADLPAVETPGATTTTTAYRFLDLVFSLDVQEASLAPLLRELLVPTATHEQPVLHCAIERPRGAETLALRVGPDVVLTTDARPLFLAHVLWELNRRAIAASQHALLLHAAAAERDGASVLLSGPSGSGKSTLVAGLVASGFAYLTDDGVRVDANERRALAHPKPINLGRDVAAHFPSLARIPPEHRRWMGDEWYVTASWLGATTGCGSPPRLVCFPMYERGARTQVTPISRAEGLVLLAENAFNFTHLGGSAVSVLAEMLRPCVCYRIVSGDLDDAVQCLDDLFSGADPGRVIA